MGRSEKIQEIIENLSRLHRPIEHNAWKTLGLSHAQVGMMYMLFHHKDCSMKQIANYLDVSQSAITQLIEPLIKIGMVERRADPKDRRIARLGLTEKGLGLLKKFKSIKTEGLRAGFASLNAKEIDSLLALTQKMTTNLNRKSK